MLHLNGQATTEKLRDTEKGCQKPAVGYSGRILHDVDDYGVFHLCVMYVYDSQSK